MPNTIPSIYLWVIWSFGSRIRLKVSDPSVSTEKINALIIYFSLQWQVWKITFHNNVLYTESTQYHPCFSFPWSGNTPMFCLKYMYCWTHTITLSSYFLFYGLVCNKFSSYSIVKPTIWLSLCNGKIICWCSSVNSFIRTSSSANQSLFRYPLFIWIQYLFQSKFLKTSLKTAATTSVAWQWPRAQGSDTIIIMSDQCSVALSDPFLFW